MFCSHCGEEAQIGSKFCSKCGRALVESSKAEVAKPWTDATIRGELKKFSDTTPIRCLECGYAGGAGILKTKRRKGLSVFLFFFGVIMLVGSFVMRVNSYLLGVLAALAIIWGISDLFTISGVTGYVVECPNCKKNLLKKL
jgi:DNA-directed RNA polymerase subunit RPC12/RpoP